MVSAGAGVFERTSALHTARAGTPGITAGTVTGLIFIPAACPRAAGVTRSRAGVLEVGFAHATLRLGIKLVICRAGAFCIICSAVVSADIPAARRTPAADVTPGIARIRVALGFIFRTRTTLTGLRYHMSSRNCSIRIRISRAQGTTFLIFPVTAGIFPGFIHSGTGLIIFRLANATGMIRGIIKARSSRCGGLSAIFVGIALFFALFFIVDFPVVLASIPAGRTARGSAGTPVRRIRSSVKFILPTMPRIGNETHARDLRQLDPVG